MDILKGVDKMIQGGNVSAIFSPVSNELFLPLESQFFNGDMLTALKRGNFKKVQIQFYIFISQSSRTIEDLDYFISIKTFNEIILEIRFLC